MNVQAKQKFSYQKFRKILNNDKFKLWNKKQEKNHVWLEETKKTEKTN